MEALSGLLRCDRHFRFQKHISGVQSGVHLHRRHSGHLFPADDRPLDRRGSAVLRKQRRMDIDTAVRRHPKDLFRQDLSKCHDDHHIRLIFAQLFHAFGFPDTFRLIHRDPQTQSRLFHRSKLHLFSSAFRLIRLRHRQTYVMSRFHKRFQCTHGKIRGSHENDLHPIPHPPALHMSRHEVRFPLCLRKDFPRDDRSHGRTRVPKAPRPPVQILPSLR